MEMFDPKSMIQGKNPNLDNAQVLAAFMDLVRLNLGDVLRNNRHNMRMSSTDLIVLSAACRVLANIRIQIGEGSEWTSYDQSNLGMDILRYCEEQALNAKSENTSVSDVADRIFNDLRNDGLIG